jgi:hypothetical protein
MCLVEYLDQHVTYLLCSIQSARNLHLINFEDFYDTVQLAKGPKRFRLRGLIRFFTHVSQIK